jgi:hypothetical protein
MFRLAVALALTGAVVLVPVEARSQDQGGADLQAHAGPVRQDRGQLGASVNNLGLQNTLERSWTWPLWASRNPLLADAHVSTGIVSVVTPALARVGGWLEVSPLSVLDVRVGAEPMAYFGTFNALKSLQSYDDPFDSKTLKAMRDRKSGYGSRLYVEPVIKAKAGAFVAQIDTTIERWQTNAPGPFFYEPTRDTLLRASGDTLLTATSLAMYQREMGDDGTLSAGVLHSVTEVFDAPGNRSQRLGVIVIREYSSTHYRVPRLRLLATVWQYLDDPSKRHQFGAAVAIGFRRER